MTATLRLHNTLTRRKEEFRPIDPSNVRLYACGPTVYDLAHIGNARPVIVFDLLFRLLRHLYGAEHVTYVRNITDVDDKINARARRDFPDVPLNDAIRRVTAETERQFQEDIRALGVLTPKDVNVAGQPARMVEPRATEHISEMRRIIDGLVASGHAYAAEGHVLFDVPSMPDYGALSRRPLDEMEAGARVEVAPYKRSPLDFVLWKPSAPDEPGWPSPAGISVLGRPGWHIECSAMAWRHLGETFDIHAGGLDLIFPHHENEIAQSRGCFGTSVMANYWLHNGFLEVEGEKMSKSLGNFVTIRDLVEGQRFGGRRWPGDVIKLAMLRTHYRQPIDWTEGSLRDALKTARSWNNTIRRVDPSSAKPSVALLTALCDDLNTPAAIAELHRLHTRATSIQAEDLPHDAANEMYWSLRLLGFDGIIAGAVGDDSVLAASVEAAYVQIQVDLRNAARAAKNWAESDRIRDELKAVGVQLRDNKDDTTTWEVARG